MQVQDSGSLKPGLKGPEPMNAHQSIILLIASLGLSHISIATAQQPDPLVQNPFSPWYALDKPAGWHFDAGIGVESEPGYAGSSTNETEVDVLARAIYRTESGHRYFLTLGEAGALFNLGPDTQLAAFIEFEEGREADDDPALVGMTDIDSTIEGQFTLARRFGNASIFATLQPDITGDANKGLVWFVGAGYERFVADNRLRLSTRFDLSGADSEYMRTEFGVTPAEAARTGYAAFTPGSGLKSATLGLGAEYYFSDRLSLLGSVEIEHYLDDAADSPLVDSIGSSTTHEASLLLRWQF